MPNRVTRRPMFRGRVDARNPMGILASSAKLANSVAMAHGGFRNPHPPVKYARDGMYNFNPISIDGRGVTSMIQPANFSGAFSMGNDMPVIPIETASLIGAAPQPARSTNTTLSGPATISELIQKASTPAENTENSSLETSEDKAAKDDNKPPKKAGTTLGELINQDPPKEYTDKLKAIAEGTAPNPVLKQAEANRTKVTGQLEGLRTTLSQNSKDINALTMEAANKQQDLASEFTQARTNLKAGLQDLQQARDGVTLADVYDKTAEAFGYKVDPKTGKIDIDEAYNDQKVQSFWLNLITAGLATAAGESSDGLTNLAKGLMVGIQGYGKDLENLNAQEREDRKEFRNALRENLRDEKSMAVTLATANNNNLFQTAQIDMQIAQAQTGAEIEMLNARKSVLNQNTVNAQAEVAVLQSIAELDLNVAQLQQAAEDRKSEAAGKLHDITQQKVATMIKAMPKEVLAGAWGGENYLTFEDDGTPIPTMKFMSLIDGIIEDSTGSSMFHKQYRNRAAFKAAFMVGAGQGTLQLMQDMWAAQNPNADRMPTFEEIVDMGWEENQRINGQQEGEEAATPANTQTMGLGTQVPTNNALYKELEGFVPNEGDTFTDTETGDVFTRKGGVIYWQQNK